MSDEVGSISTSNAKVKDNTDIHISQYSVRRMGWLYRLFLLHTEKALIIVCNSVLVRASLTNTYKHLYLNSIGAVMRHHTRETAAVVGTRTHRSEEGINAPMILYRLISNKSRDPGHFGIRLSYGCPLTQTLRSVNESFHHH